MAKKIPYVGANSYINNIELKADIAMANILVSEASQSNIFRSSVTSIPGIFSEGNGNIELTISLLRSKLENYLLRIFDGAVVDVFRYDGIDEDASKQTIIIRAMIVDDDKQYNLEKLLREVNGKYTYITNINNGTV
ncbi:MAG: hypothetical protein M0R77_00890 [Gammaproteobacteria bacterium]|nr:hypothetical protein [Acholeplasmataceae bacterium]MCK9529111.1 hypothetical protein [Gammaproteobacteria bacterium]